MRSVLILGMRSVLILLLWLLVPAFADERAAAEASAQAFLQKIDAGQYAAAYKSSAEIVRKNVSEKDFGAQIGEIRAKLGSLKSRKLARATPSDKIPSAPAGLQFMVLEYTAQYTNATVTETVSPMLEKDGHWRVGGYRFK